MKFLAAIALAAAADPSKEEAENYCRVYRYRYYDHGLHMWRYRSRYVCHEEDDETELYRNWTDRNYNWHDKKFQREWNVAKARYDFNRNGMAESNEMAVGALREGKSAASGRWLHRVMDHNKDGHVTRDEHLGARRWDMWNKGKRFDYNRDGQLSRAEYNIGARAFSHGVNRNTNNEFTRMDKNHNGKVSRREFVYQGLV